MDAALSPDCGRAGARSSTITAITWRCATAGSTRRPVRGAGTSNAVGTGVGSGVPLGCGVAVGVATADGGATLWVAAVDRVAPPAGEPVGPRAELVAADGLAAVNREGDVATART